MQVAAEQQQPNAHQCRSQLKPARTRCARYAGRRLEQRAVHQPREIPGAASASRQSSLPWTSCAGRAPSASNARPCTACCGMRLHSNTVECPNPSLSSTMKHPVQLPPAVNCQTLNAPQHIPMTSAPPPFCPVVVRPREGHHARRAAGGALSPRQQRDAQRQARGGCGWVVWVCTGEVG